LEKIFKFFIVRYRFSLTLSFFILISGLLGLRLLVTETFPPVDFAMATVTTIYPGSSPEEVEEKITKKIEEEIRTVDGIKDVRSISQSGQSLITIRIDMDNVNTKEVMDDLQRAVQRVADLPYDILEEPKFVRLNTKEIPILQLGVTGPNENRERDIIADEIKELAEDVDGVSNVDLPGYTEREFQILLDSRKMRRFHIGISEVVDAVRKRTRNIPAGYIKTEREQRLIRVQGQVSSADEMGDIVIRSNFDGLMVKVHDVAEIRDGAEEPSVRVRLNGREATLLTVTKKEKADAIDTVRNVILRIDEYNKRLPPGFTIDIYNNESDRIHDRLKIVIGNSIVGLVFVIVILFIFLPGVLGAMTAISLPLTVFAIMALMAAFEVTFNKITMLGLVIVIGMLVDNSVVISENYARLRQSGLKVLEAATRAVYQFWLPISATVLTTIAAFLPMLVMKGIMGEFVKFVPIIVCLALTLSLFESFFLLPARLRFTVKNDPGGGEKNGGDGYGWFKQVAQGFKNLLSVLIRFRYLVFLGMVLLLAGSVMLAVVGNRFELFPQEDVEMYIARFEMPLDSTLEQTDKIAAILTSEIRSAIDEKEIKYIVVNSGVSRFGLSDPRGRDGDDVAMITIGMHRESASRQDYQIILKKLRKISVEGVKKLTFEARAGGPPVGMPLTVTLRSNKDYLREMAVTMLNRLKKIDGIVDASLDEIPGGQEYHLELDYHMLARMKLSTEDVGMALRTALQGTAVSELNIDNNEFDLRVRYRDRSRETIEALKATEIMDKSGNLIPLTSIAKLKKKVGPSVKKHLDYRRAITIVGDVIPEKITSIEANREAEKIFKDLSQRYSGVSVKFGGEKEHRQESIESLFNAMVLAVFGIFVILIFLFNSFLRPFIILSNIPLGLVGVSVSFFIHNKPLGFLALIGVVGLAGVVVNSAIVLISYIDDLSLERKDMSFFEILAEASSRRLRAVVVTGLTTVGGLLPTAYSIGGHDAILVPMTLALAWGLVSGSVLTLVWVPCSMAILKDIENYLFAWISARRVKKIKLPPCTGGSTSGKILLQEKKKI